MKTLVASCLVIALGIILIVHFALFWVYGGVYIYEGNAVILCLETMMSVAVLCFGIERFQNSVRKKE